MPELEAAASPLYRAGHLEHNFFRGRNSGNTTANSKPVVVLKERPAAGDVDEEATKRYPDLISAANEELGQLDHLQNCGHDSFSLFR